MKNLFLILFLLSNIASYSQHNAKTKADSLLTATLFKEAVAEYTKLIKAEPKNDTLLRNRAVSYFYLQEIDKSEADFKKVLKINPQCLSCENYLIKILWAKEKTSEALQKADSCIKVNQDSGYTSMQYSEILKSKTQLHSALGEEEKAAQTMDKLVQTYSDSSWAYFARAQYNFDNGSKSSALKDIEKAISLDSTKGYYYRLKGQLYNKIKYHTLALELFDKAINIDSVDALNYSYRAEILYNEFKKYKEALIDVTKAIELDSTNWQFFALMTSIYHGLEDMDGECICIKKVITLTEGEKLSDEANDYIENFKRQYKNLCNPQTPSYYYQRGIAMYNLNLFDSAVVYYTIGLKKFPGNSLILNFRGNAHLRIGHWDKAEKDYLASITHSDSLIKFIKLERVDLDDTEQKNYAKDLIASAYESLSEAYLNKSNPTQALWAIDTAFTIRSNSDNLPLSTFYYQKGKIYMAMAEYDKAFENFEKVKMLEPNDPEGYLNMAISLANKAAGKKEKYMKFGVSAKSNTPGGFNLNYDSEPIQLSSTSSPLLNEALVYCDQAVALNAPDNGQSYLVRGYIKYLKGSPSACQDVRIAIQAGNGDALSYFAKICK